MNSDQFTLITCSYNTPVFTECMLMSFTKYHEGVNKIIIIENSDPSDKTRSILDKNNIPYVDGHKVLPPAPEKDGWGWSHHKGLDWAVNNCDTPYCLIVDTDILFKRNIDYLFDFFAHSCTVNTGMLGSLQEKGWGGSNKLLVQRIHPSFMMLNADYFKEKKLTFNGSITTDLDEKIESYDVGSYIYRRMQKDGKQIIDIGPCNNIYIGDDGDVCQSAGVSPNEIIIANGHGICYHGLGLSWEEHKMKPMLDFYNQLVYNQMGKVDMKDRFSSNIEYKK